MSTITKEFTKEQLIEQAKKNIEVLRGAVEKIPGASDAAVIHLKLAEITLASLEAEASWRNPVLAYADSYRDMAKQGVESIPVWSVITDLERNIAPLFTAHPAQVSVPDERAELQEYRKAHAALKALDIAKLEEVREWIRELRGPTKAEMDSFIKIKYFILDFRAAMLNGGKS